MAPLPKPKDDKFYELRSFRVPKNRIEFRKARKLSDVPGYVWYSPAALYLWGKYSDTHLSDMVQRFDAKFFWYRFNRPLFKGLEVAGDAAWNHTLWAAPENMWDKILDAVLETVQFDIPLKLLFQYALQSMEIVDPLYVDHQATVTTLTPTLRVKLFAVLSNERQYAFDTSKGFTLGAVPRIVSFKPSDLHVRAGRRLFAVPRLTQDKAFAKYKEIISEKPKHTGSARKQ